MKIGDFKVFEKSLDGSYLIVLSYHPSWSITWRFILSWHYPKKHRNCKTYLHRVHQNRYFQWCVKVFNLGCLCYVAQPTMKRNGR